MCKLNTIIRVYRTVHVTSVVAKLAWNDAELGCKRRPPVEDSEEIERTVLHLLEVDAICFGDFTGYRRVQEI